MLSRVMRMLTALVLAVFLSAGAASAADGANVPAEARAFFAQYQLLTTQFSRDLLDLYADDADIQGWHKDGRSGKIAKMKYSAAQQRDIFDQTVPKMKEMGAQAKFGEPAFKTEGKGVRINVDFMTVLPQGSIPGRISLLVEPNKNGVWLIEQELTYSGQ